ncbi:MAG: tRNA lysidine(34) synthetase TilS [Akkermansiaceae bacterium]|nr:tRNA lysidine(34) synthetase TilS [Akkermansiaceae bacterium]
MWLRNSAAEERWLVGVSGGADSVALLHLLVEKGFRDLVVCHLDHGLRGEDSTGDAEFVSKLAGEFGLLCEIGTADVKGRMAEKGESLETAARNVRHDFFGKCAEKYGSEKILLAHHADDQAETVLWNLLRGSHGFKGMREEQQLATESGVELRLIRPLLGTRREKIIEWLKEKGHKWREDTSNKEPIAVRNRLRNEAFPLLNEISNRDAAAAFIRGAENSADHVALEDWALKQANVLDPQGRLHLPVLRKLPVALQRIAVRKFLLFHGISSLDADLIERSLELLDIENSAVINLPGGGRLRRRAGRLWVEI